MKNLYSRYRKFRSELELGLRVRNGIHYVTSSVYPYAKVVLPNFRAVHYFYIISMVFLGSVIVYPMKNVKYVDALFTTSGASTQAGLNTVDINKLALYQQIVIYVIADLTTPIYIHGSLLFVRLYWFERHFDNIKESSKLNFKMRRSATIAAARTESLNATRINTVNNQGLGLSNTNVDPHTVFKNEDGHIVVTDGSPQSSSSQTNNNNVAHISEPSDSDEQHRGITFGELPHPPTTQVRKKEIDPSDMYRSIAMLQDNHNNNKINNHSPTPPPTTHIQFSDNVHDKYLTPNHPNDEDDVLIIKPPNEIEKSDKNIPIFTRKQRRLSSSSGIKKWKLNRSNSNQWTSKLKKSFSNSAIGGSPKGSRRHHLPKRFNKKLFSPDDEDLDDEDDLSIDSETDHHIDDVTDDVHDDEDDEDDEDDHDGDDEDSDNHSDNNSHNDSVDSEINDVAITRSPSDLEPNSKETNGRTSTTEDSGSQSHLPKASTFDRFIASKKKRAQNPSMRNRLKKYRTPVYFRNNSRSMTSDNSDEEQGLESSSEYPTDYDGHDLRKVMSTNYLSWVPTVGRNSTFVDMSDEQKEELGGVEYRAVKLLIKILLFYYIGCHILAALFLLPWILKEPEKMEILRSQGISATWWAFFTAQSSFNDLGFTLTPNSMMSFNESVYVLIVVCFFVVIGNTGFPVFLRFIIWVLFKFAKPLSLFKESLGFLLDHPRRCFTLLFPSVATWWLFFILVVLNAVDLVLFIVLDLNNEYLSEIPVGYRIMDGLFQAFSTRTAGFSVLDLSLLHPAVQVSYMLMMYISVLPLAISIRRTNVYEEQSLGIYLKDEENEDEQNDKTPKTFIGTHLRNQLSFDLWFIFLGLFIICIAEGSKLNKGNIRFTVFSILFEIISAYGTVGLSLGFPNVNASLSYEFTTLSKLVIIAMMIRGRHRGLPYSLDRAIMLPDKDMQRLDRVQEHHAVRRNTTLERVNTGSSTLDNGQEFSRLRRAVSRRFSDANPFKRRGSTAGLNAGLRSHTSGMSGASLNAQVSRSSTAGQEMGTSMNRNTSQNSGGQFMDRLTSRNSGSSPPDQVINSPIVEGVVTETQHYNVIDPEYEMTNLSPR